MMTQLKDGVVRLNQFWENADVGGAATNVEGALKEI